MSRYEEGIKLIEELQQIWKNSTDEVAYFQTNIDWLQSRFPEAKYADVIGLCKVADKTEYTEEQDYSMNAGRYVGIVDNDGFKSFNDYKDKIFDLNQKLNSLKIQSKSIELTIEENINNLFI